VTGARLLFVLGLGRSGTTPLTELFSAHPEIALGMERYKRLYGRRNVRIEPDLFERDRFFDFSDGLTNITPDVHERWANYYAQIEARWDSASYVGDKITQAVMQRIWRSLPDAKFICIVRDIEQVAASWDVRAKRASDVNWPERANARDSVMRWNQALRRIRRAVKQRPEDAVVVEHSRFFGDPDGHSMAGVLDWLGRERAREMDEHFAQAHARFVESIAPKQRSMSDADAAYVREAADRAAWRQLLRRAV
jgi:Sulfotransferase family